MDDDRTTTTPIIPMLGSITRLLQKVRETVALDRRYGAEDLAGVIAWLLDDGVHDSISAVVTARAEGNEIVVSLRHHDGTFDRTSDVAQEFVVTVVPREPGL